MDEHTSRTQDREIASSSPRGTGNGMGRGNRKSQSNRIYAGEVSGAEVESWWHQESIAGTETGRRRIS